MQNVGFALHKLLRGLHIHSHDHVRTVAVVLSRNGEGAFVCLTPASQLYQMSFCHADLTSSIDRPAFLMSRNVAAA